MTKLYRFDAAGRCLGWIEQDRPIEEYAARLGVDLTTEIPPEAPVGYEQVLVAGSWVLRQVVTPQPSLEEVKAQKWREMKQARQAALCAPLTTPHGTFDADEDGRANIIQTAHLMQTEAQALSPGQQPTVEFTLADNSVVTLTAGQMVQVALLLAAQVQAAYARGRVVRAAIDAATTSAQVQAITWSKS